MTPGWYPDPTGRYEHRYHNGAAWTADVASRGERHVDALGVAPTPAPVYSPPDIAPTNGLATAALVTGAVGAAVGLVFLFPLSIPLGILAIVFGAIGLRRSRVSGVGRPQAITGLITGPLALVLSVVAVVSLWDDLVEAFDEARATARSATDYDIELEPAVVEGGQVSCAGTLANERSRDRDFLVRIEFLPGGSSEPLVVEPTTLSVAGQDSERFVVVARIDGDVARSVRCSVDSVRVIS